MPLIPAKFSSRGPRVAEQHKVHDIDPYTDRPWKILWRAMDNTLSALEKRSSKAKTDREMAANARTLDTLVRMLQRFFDASQRAKEKRRKHPERFQTLGEARAELIRRLDERLEGQQALERWEKEQEAEKAGSGDEPTAV
jgi:hypothetical protein